MPANPAVITSNSLEQSWYNKEAVDQIVNNPAPKPPNYVTAKVFTATWNWSQSSTALTRGDDAVGKVFTPATSGSGGSSGFDGEPIYRDIRLCNLVNGVVTKYENEPGFERDPANGDVMVQIPKFYCKIVNDPGNTARSYSISATKIDDSWMAAPAFDRSHEGLPDREYIYVGAYTCNVAYRSLSGKTSITSIRREVARNNCTNKGAGYYQWDFKTWWTINLLYLVEVANWNSQAAVGYGYVSGSNGGQTNTGGTDGIAFHSGSTVAAGDQTGTVKYRNMENLWGNIWQFIDGISMNQGAIYVANRPSYNSDDTAANHTQLSYVAPTTSGYQKELGFDETMPWAQVCTTASGAASNTYIADYYYHNASEWRVVFVGGYWNATAGAGLFCFTATYASTLANAYLGCRLLFLP